jgi:hypothetical protein
MITIIVGRAPDRRVRTPTRADGPDPRPARRADAGLDHHDLVVADADLVARYAARWAIEVTFFDTPQPHRPRESSHQNPVNSPHCNRFAPGPYQHRNRRGSIWSTQDHRYRLGSPASCHRHEMEPSMRMRLVVTITALTAATFGVAPAVAGPVVAAVGAGHANAASGSDQVEAGRSYRFWGGGH